MNDESIRTATDLVRVQDLASLVTMLNRFLMRLSVMPPFQEAGLGLAEWSVLSIIAERSGVNNRQLANAIGVSPQRINQITDSLKRGLLISVSSSKTDARKKVISITAVGTTRLRELDAKLQPYLVAALEKRPGLLTRANGLFSKALMRIVVSVKKGQHRNG